MSFKYHAQATWTSEVETLLVFCDFSHGPVDHLVILRQFWCQSSCAFISLPKGLFEGVTFSLSCSKKEKLNWAIIDRFHHNHFWILGNDVDLGTPPDRNSFNYDNYIFLFVLGQQTNLSLTEKWYLLSVDSINCHLYYIINAVECVCVYSEKHWSNIDL